MPTIITPWTDDRVEFVRTHIENGYTCGQVAALLGDTTRNAIIGIMNRRGISSPNKSGFPKPKRGRIRKKKSQNVSIFATRWGASDPNKTAPGSIEVVNVVAQPLHVSLARLNNITCRWPYGEGPYTFCGCPTSKAPYCEAHTVQSRGKPTTSERLASYAPKEAVAA